MEYADILFTMSSIWKNLLTTSLMWGAFLLAHQVSYFIAYPSATDRAHELSHSGHGWLPIATHYGAPAILAILTVGLFTFTRSKTESFRNASKYLAFSTAGLFVGVETLERAIAAAGPYGHGFYLNSTVLLVGTVIAFGAGALLGGLYYTAQQFILTSITSFQYIVASPVKATATSTHNFAGPNVLLQHSIVRSGHLRGPPSL